MDSRAETYKHIKEVQRLIGAVIGHLMKRAFSHDESKLSSPEVECFDQYTNRLHGLTYGSEEYEKVRSEMPALQHHYKMNRHHPEHHAQGIKGMNLLDILEMLCDWKASSLRHANGDIMVSIEKNQPRFGYSDELKQILLNTLGEME